MVHLTIPWFGHQPQNCKSERWSLSIGMGSFRFQGGLDNFSVSPKKCKSCFPSYLIPQNFVTNPCSFIGFGVSDGNDQVHNCPLNTNGSGCPCALDPDPPVQWDQLAGGQQLTLMSRMYFLVIDHFPYKLRKNTFAEANDLLRSLPSSKSRVFLSPFSRQ